MTDREVMQMALDAITTPHPGLRTSLSESMIYREKIKTTIEALRAALAQPEPEPVGRFAKFSDGIWKEVTDGSAGQPLYAAPQKKEWVGLTREELAEIAEFHFHGALSAREFYDDVEAKLKEKNT